jgi:hypothetical protein
MDSPAPWRGEYASESPGSVTPGAFAPPLDGQAYMPRSSCTRSTRWIATM